MHDFSFRPSEIKFRKDESRARLHRLLVAQHSGTRGHPHVSRVKDMHGLARVMYMSGVMVVHIGFTKRNQLPNAPSRRHDKRRAWLVDVTRSTICSAS